MSRTLPRRLLAQSPLSVTKESRPSFKLPLRCLRPFSQSSPRPADDLSDPMQSLPRGTPRQRPAPRSPSLNPASKTNSMAGLSELIGANVAERDRKEANRYNPAQIYDSDILSTSLVENEAARRTKPHLFSVYATRHNTHINVSKPYEWDPKKSTKENEENEKKHPYNVMMTLSAGNLGFRHSARKHYDSAFQVAAVVMERMQARGLNEGIKKLEVHLRGFGAGREAVTKALLGSEGRLLRHKIVKVADNTRLKFGGTRSKKPRRLG